MWHELQSVQHISSCRLLVGSTCGTYFGPKSYKSHFTEGLFRRWGVFLHVKRIPTRTVASVRMDALFVCVCVCLCRRATWIPAFQSFGLKLKHSGKQNGGRGTWNENKRVEKERMRGLWLLMIPSILKQRSQGLFLCLMRGLYPQTGWLWCNLLSPTPSFPLVCFICSKLNFSCVASQVET